MFYKYTDIKNIVAEIIESRKEEGGVKSLYFVGCGGSLGALYPAKTFMQNECADIKCGWINSNEFVHAVPKDFGRNSIICVACHKGNTPETIAAAKLGKERGAAVILLTWLEESEIIEFGDYVILYSFDASPDHLAGDIDYAGEKVLCALSVAVELLNQTAGYEHYDKFLDGLDRISVIIRKARKMVQARAEKFAQEYKDQERWMKDASLSSKNMQGGLRLWMPKSLVFPPSTRLSSTISITPCSITSIRFTITRWRRPASIRSRPAATCGE